MEKKKVMCKNDFSKTNYNILIHEQSVDCQNATLSHDIGFKDSSINKELFKNSRSEHKVTSVSITSR